MRSMVLLTGIVIAGSGCGTQSGTEHPDDGDAGCTSSQQALGLDEVSSLGFAGDDVVAALPADARATLTWSDDATTTITFALTGAEGSASFTDFEQDPDSEDTCETPDRLYVPVTYTISTEDGRLDASGTGSVWSETGADAVLVVNVTATGGPACEGEQTLHATLTATTASGTHACEGETTWEMASW